MGTAPTVSLGVNPATNRISTSGFVYDAAGNLTAWPVGNETVTAWYTYENQMRYVTTPAGSESYSYTVAGQRARQGRTGMPDRYFFYGLRGELLGIYGEAARANGTYYISTVHSTRVWLGGLLVSSGGNSITRDQLGSVVNSGTETLSYYPYGEQRAGTATNDREKFATYLRDENTRLDYAQARYYSSTWGRFTTADPYTMSGGLGNPQGWNRYAYVNNSPVNANDPEGLNAKAPSDTYEISEPATCGDIPVLEGGTVRSNITANSDDGLMARIIWHESFAWDVGSDNSGYYAEKYTIGLAMLNRYAIAHGELTVYDKSGHALAGADLGFGDASTSLTDVMLTAAGRGESWGIINGEGNDLKGNILQALNKVLNSSFKTGTLYDFQGPFGTYKVNAECYQVLSSLQASYQVLHGTVRQASGGVVATFWNLSTTGNPGLASLVALLGKTSAYSPTVIWGFIYGWAQ